MSGEVIADTQLGLCERMRRENRALVIFVQLCTRGLAWRRQRCSGAAIIGLVNFGSTYIGFMSELYDGSCAADGLHNEQERHKVVGGHDGVLGEVIADTRERVRGGNRVLDIFVQLWLVCTRGLAWRRQRCSGAAMYWLILEALI